MREEMTDEEIFTYGREIENLQSKWIEFHVHAHTGKTFQITVWTEGMQHMLGTIKWFGRWRRYSFFPSTDTVFEWECMRMISNVCEKMTKDHRTKYVRAYPKLKAIHLVNGEVSVFDNEFNKIKEFQGTLTKKLFDKLILHADSETKWHGFIWDNVLGKPLFEK